MTLDRGQLAKRIYAASHLTGEFVLRSGAISNEYFDKYRFEADPRLLNDICLHLREHIDEEADALAGLELGGVPIAAILSQITNLPLIQVRKQAKSYGTCRQVEGGDIRGRALVIVEDVVTSAGQIVQSAAVLRDLGATILGVVCVVDREAGGQETLAVSGLSFHPLFRMSELKRSARDA